MKKLIWFVLALMMAQTACAATEAPAKPAYKKITAGEAWTLIDGEDPYILLDVRTAEEFEDAHIDGAILIPDDEIASRAEAELPDKDALILVYCRSGRRSAGAAKALIGLGYTNVLDFGGIIDWPYETVSGPAAAQPEEVQP